MSDRRAILVYTGEYYATYFKPAGPGGKNKWRTARQIETTHHMSRCGQRALNTLQMPLSGRRGFPSVPRGMGARAPEGERVHRAGLRDGCAAVRRRVTA
jgi:hypothetical protein